MTHYVILNGGRQASAAVRGSAARRPPIFPPANSRCGSGLILTVLFVALVGILLGLGRLAMFRDQCVRRFDRQREIERTLATRSVLRYIQSKLDRRKYEDIRTSTNMFVYIGNHGRDYSLTLRPSEPILDSDLKQGWEGVCDDGAGTGIVLDKRSFSFNVNGISNRCCLIGQVLPSSWLAHPWGLRFTVWPGGTGPGSDVGLADTILCMYLVGGTLPTEGLCKADLANNPVIRVDNLYKGGSGTDPRAELRVYYGEHGLNSIDELHPLSALVDEGVKWKHRYGVQLAGENAALFEHGALEVVPTFAIGSLPSQTSGAFIGNPRLYIGARQIGPPTNATYLVESVVVRPPYEWDVVVRWDQDGTPVEEIATVIHAAGEKGGRPTMAVSYDTHGTQRRPGGR